MGSPISVYFSLNYLVILLYYYLSSSGNLVLSGDAIESPNYTVVHSEPDLEIRLYVESSWMSALAQGPTSFEKSTKYGFHRLYQYIHGGNLNHSKIPMTAPVLTSINSSSSPGADYFVRLFPEDKTHISTGIAGTLGYMAPEYVVRGKLTEKADVYSFGVLVIEVVCGKRNNAFSQDSHSILQRVWSLHGTGRLCEAVDPVLEGKFQEEEASRLLQIGLLCVQASAELRPSMSLVVKMITDNHEIAQPTQPPFLNSSSAEVSQNIPPPTYYSQPESYNNSSGNDITNSGIEPR
ncbi:cysteine-rich receptor-like protein kinase 3 [Corylus avellana]|uniref:cysteine-rich receptor-like protein kinase 3 n=1 Tax=Corylus avellana TaxID=13451 RepID=UPI00286A9F14|nr:cysteine-rich receptor-like protein kinase 3 [Corylus avellana]